MLNKNADQPLPIPFYLALFIVFKKQHQTLKDSEHLLQIYDLCKQEGGDQLDKECQLSSLSNPIGIHEMDAGERKELDGWLAQLGESYFQDVEHLFRIAGIINKQYHIKLGHADKLDAEEENELDDWLAQCDQNRNFYKHLTDVRVRAEADAINSKEVWKSIKGESWWKKLWKQILKLITGKKKKYFNETDGLKIKMN